MTEYRVPAGYGEAELTEKRSRFISHIWHVETEEEAVAKIKEIREKHWDARHNVYAYVIRDSGIMRYSDDGEPQGTSGMPTLNVLRGAELTNVCCVTTRYFGGILLGTGGLVRAYSGAAKMALENAGIAVMRLWNKTELNCAYNLFERIKREIENVGGVIENIDYAADIKITFLVPEEQSEVLESRITELSAGNITVRITDNCFMGVKIE